VAGRQALNVREWVPPIVCANDEIVLLKEYVMFSTDVVESFKGEFIDAVNYLYDVTPVKKPSSRREGNVVAFSQLLKDPSTKPN
jgi:hypothetical protein